MKKNVEKVFYKAYRQIFNSDNYDVLLKKFRSNFDY